MAKTKQEDVIRFADMLGAMGTEPRLKIMRLLLSAHPEGMVVGEIGSELEISPSTLSHHLDKLKNEGLVSVRRDKMNLYPGLRHESRHSGLAKQKSTGQPAIGLAESQ